MKVGSAALQHLIRFLMKSINYKTMRMQSAIHLHNFCEQFKQRESVKGEEQR